MDIAILYRAFHTTKESRREEQPCELKFGTIVTWDGRLDNREELISQLDQGLPQESTDLEIVCAAYERWQTRAFAQFLGDWAISVWNPKDRSIILAKDFLGARHLYYRRDKDQVTWCTILDPLVLKAGCSFEFEEEYIAGWLAYFPATHLTSYVGIHAVRPSSFVRITPVAESTHKYWDFDSRKRIRYRIDTEYEEHFRLAFAESVRRRLRSDKPILAELSGGMDSSSIVCVADEIIGKRTDRRAIIDTLSYYDNTEPNWNELPYVRAVETNRGKIGCHIDVAANSTVPGKAEPSAHFAASPAAQTSKGAVAEQFAIFLEQHGYKVLLSGIG